VEIEVLGKEFEGLAHLLRELLELTTVFPRITRQPLPADPGDKTPNAVSKAQSKHGGNGTRRDTGPHHFIRDRRRARDFPAHSTSPQSTPY
jgi:hypothetical protein